MMKRNYLKALMATTVVTALLAGCGGGGGSGNNLPPPDLTYRNLALKAAVQSSVDPKKSDVRAVNDGITNLNNAYWTGFNKDDQFLVVFNDFKQVNKLVIYTNDLNVNSATSLKTISVAKSLNANGKIEWLDVYFDKPPTTTPTTGTTGTVTTPQYLVCSSHKEENNTITCNFDNPLYLLFVQLRMNTNSQGSQHIYEFQVWGNDAPR